MSRLIRRRPAPLERPHVTEWARWLTVGMDETLIGRGERASVPLARAAATAGAVAFEIALTDRLSPLRRSRPARRAWSQMLPRFAWGGAIRLFQDGFNEQKDLYAGIGPDDRQSWFASFEGAFAQGHPLREQARTFWETYHGLPDGAVDVAFEHDLARWLAAPVLELPGHVGGAPDPSRERWRLAQTMLAATTVQGVVLVGETLDRIGVVPPRAP